MFEELRLRPRAVLGYGCLGELNAETGQKDKALQDLKLFPEGVLRMGNLVNWMDQVEGGRPRINVWWKISGIRWLRRRDRWGVAHLP